MIGALSPNPTSTRWGLVELHLEHEMVDEHVGTTEQHGGAEPADLEAERSQQGGERTVCLEAPPAAAPFDHLRPGPVLVGRDRAPAEHVECLERHGLQMGELQCGQGLEVVADRAVEPDPLEIGVDVTGRHHPTVDSPPSTGCVASGGHRPD